MKNGIVYKNGTFARPDTQGKFHIVLKPSTAALTTTPTVFVNCHVQGNSAGQAGGDLSAQHGFNADFPSGHQTVYWNNCTSDDNYGDGFNIAKNCTVTCVDLTATNNQRSGIVTASNQNTVVRMRRVTTDGRFDIETSGANIPLDFYAQDGTVGFIEVNMAQDCTAYFKNFTTTKTTGYSLRTAIFTVGGGSNASLELVNCDLTSAPTILMEHTVHVSFQNCQLPGVVTTPTSGLYDTDDIDVVRHYFKNCTFTKTCGRTASHDGCICHPGDGAQIGYDMSTGDFEYHIENCTFTHVPNGYPVRIWGGDIHFQNLRHSNAYLFGLQGATTTCRVYDDKGTLLTTESTGLQEYNPPAAAEKSAATRTPGNRHTFRPWDE
jgi:hypothetical protein